MKLAKWSCRCRDSFISEENIRFCPHCGSKVSLNQLAFLKVSDVVEESLEFSYRVESLTEKTSLIGNKFQAERTFKEWFNHAEDLSVHCHCDEKDSCDETCNDDTDTIRLIQIDLRTNQETVLFSKSV